MKKRVADIIVETLIEVGITQCFAVVGGGAMHLDNALALHKEMNVVFCHHEQACAMAAEGYAKACGKPALVCVTSGPGALNTLNGVQGAYVDNTPMIVIAGHPRWETTVNVTGLDLRYRGVQECDMVPMVKGMTKHAAYLLDPTYTKNEVIKALRIAMDGRRGPVWLSVPLDVQGAFVETGELVEEQTKRSLFAIDDKSVEELNNDIQNAKRPVILPGSGVSAGGEVKRFRDWVERMNIPVVAGSLLPDIMYEGAKNFYGTSGILGERRGNFILQNSDLIIAIGNSLTSKQIGFNSELFAPYAKIVMVDACEDEAKKPGVRVDRFIHSDVTTFFDNVKAIDLWKVNDEWIEYCDSLKAKLGDIDRDDVPNDEERVPARYMWDIIRKTIPDNMTIALGNNSGLQNCLQKSVHTPNQRVILNYNSGSMGLDLPEAVGIVKALNREVLCVTGDGSVMMNLQELQTIKHYDLPVKIIIMSNDGYGGIRQTNKNFFDGLYVGCDKESGVGFPDFAGVAKAFGVGYRKCEKVKTAEADIKWLLNEKQAAILEICQKLEDPSSPKLKSKLKEDGTFETPAIQDLWPYISEELMKELMPYK
ncbi:MAG: thiamine pyrophosphate-binding protein [Lachnospiraceae bacterium]|nr:thiamine pyrophosphate-binding protein [Lachnospiraceae bacterium]